MDDLVRESYLRLLRATVEVLEAFATATITAVHNPAVGHEQELAPLAQESLTLASKLRSVLPF